MPATFYIEDPRGKGFLISMALPCVRVESLASISSLDNGKIEFVN